jgi:hypothetical protein
VFLTYDHEVFSGLDIGGTSGVPLTGARGGHVLTIGIQLRVVRKHVAEVVVFLLFLLVCQLHIAAI